MTHNQRSWFEFIGKSVATAVVLFLVAASVWFAWGVLHGVAR